MSLTERYSSDVYLLKCTSAHRFRSRTRVSLAERYFNISEATPSYSVELKQQRATAQTICTVEALADLLACFLLKKLKEEEEAAACGGRG